ncbi:hypothetical protein M3Y98_00717000 [Aphelenchoides besseyi]|nr:hypothetical protein M3Y98_00717000 [Aphelenchoides besseyi]KAI6210275.1 hypothetical protein M3Y96_00310800 [Aphelenchoides besseyi]
MMSIDVQTTTTNPDEYFWEKSIAIPIYGVLITVLLIFTVIVGGFITQWCLIAPSKRMKRFYEDCQLIFDGMEEVYQRKISVRYIDWEKQYAYEVETLRLEESLRRLTEELGFPVGPEILIPSESEFYEQQKLAECERLSFNNHRQRKAIHSRPSEPSKLRVEKQAQSPKPKAKLNFVVQTQKQVIRTPKPSVQLLKPKTPPQTDSSIKSVIPPTIDFASSDLTDLPMFVTPQQVQAHRQKQLKH